jgi:hypothetical protein
MEPQLSVIQQVEGHECHPLVLWHLAHVEVSLTVIKPRKGITGAIKFQKLELVGRRGEIPTGGPVIIAIQSLA